MSILIKGIDMPKRHLFEAFVAIGDGQIVVKDLEKNKLFEGKIEEVPTPHGRLIDADELKKKLEKHREMCGDIELAHGIDEAIRILENAPTIIEAEVSENA